MMRRGEGGGEEQEKDASNDEYEKSGRGCHDDVTGWDRNKQGGGYWGLIARQGNKV